MRKTKLRILETITFLTILSFLILSSCQNEKIAVLETGSVTPMPAQWIDKDTGHKIVRLTEREGNNRSFYFHNNPFYKGVDGKEDRMIFYGEVDEKRQLFSLSLKTLEMDQITQHSGNVSKEILGVKSRKVFYQSNDSVFSTHIDQHVTELIYVFPDSLNGSVTSLNADETILGGVIADPLKNKIYKQFPEKSDYFSRIYDEHIPHTLITINVLTGELKKLYSENAWLNHVQFSPTDPDVLMFCHEGPWHLVNRIWNINVSGGEPRLMHERTMHREIAGHEFFSVDGNTVWFDLQKPRGETFYLAGVNLETGVEKSYAMTRDEWSIHFNISPDQKLFAGDGGDSGQVAKASDGMWLYLFTPEGDSLKSQKLVNMKHHYYKLEPNVHFTPDGKWIVFRANFEGKTNVYAVEINTSAT